MKAREVYDDTIDLALDLEQALVCNAPLNICLLDNSKYFDNFAWQTLFPLALKLGAPKELVRIAKSFYQQAVGRFRIADSYGPPFAPTNGVGQGCALSLRWANVASVVWLRMLDMRYKGLVTGATYVDARNMRIQRTQDWGPAIGDTKRLDTQTGQSMNVTKSTAFVVGSPRQRKEIGETSFEGNKILVEEDAKALGAHIIARRQKRCRFGEQRAAAALLALGRLENLGCPWQARIPMAASAAIQKWTNGSAVARPSNKNAT